MGLLAKQPASIVGFFGALQKVALTCGIAAAVCAIIVVAILIMTSNNPMGREEAKKQLITIAIGCALLATTGTLLAIVANIGASF